MNGLTFWSDILHFFLKPCLVCAQKQLQQKYSALRTLNWSLSIFLEKNCTWSFHLLEKIPKSTKFRMCFSAKFRMLLGENCQNSHEQNDNTVYCLLSCMVWMFSKTASVNSRWKNFACLQNYPKLQNLARVF